MKLFSLKKLSVLSLVGVALLASGCGKPEKGDKGEDGGRIISTLNCSGEVTGSISELNGLEIEYDAVLTSSGDVYATANVIDLDQQFSGTSFYAAGQQGADKAQVLITADMVGSANAGYFAISLDRNTLIATARYEDASLSGPVTMTFHPSACKVRNW